MRWKFVLEKAADLEPITVLSQARDRSVQLASNRPGGASFKMPITADYAEEIEPWATSIRALRWNHRASEAAGEPIWDDEWSGPVYNIDEDISGNSMTVNAVGWLGRLDQRYTRRKLVFTATDDGEIIL